MGTSEVSACLFHRALAALSVAAALFLPSRMGCNSWDGAVTGGFAQVSCVMPASWQRVFFRERRRLFSKDLSAAEVAPRGDRQSSTGGVAIKCMLPRRHCLEARQKNPKQGRLHKG